MSINLADIRIAVINYVNTQVTVRVSNVIMQGSAINPSENFSIKVEATNADAASGGIPLRDVIWHVQVQDEAVAKLNVPEEPMEARSGLSRSLPTLTPGSQVREMYLFPPTGAGNYLGVGDSDKITIGCQAGSASTGGSCFIYTKIYASMDESWILPKDEDSYTYPEYIEVVG